MHACSAATTVRCPRCTSTTSIRREAFALSRQGVTRSLAAARAEAAKRAALLEIAMPKLRPGLRNCPRRYYYEARPTRPPHSGVAQSAEHSTVNRRVVGSSPTPRANTRAAPGGSRRVQGWSPTPAPWRAVTTPPAESRSRSATPSPTRSRSPTTRRSTARRSPSRSAGPRDAWPPAVLDRGLHRLDQDVPGWRARRRVEPQRRVRRLLPIPVRRTPGLTGSDRPDRPSAPRLLRPRGCHAQRRGPALQLGRSGRGTGVRERPAARATPPARAIRAAPAPVAPRAARPTACRSAARAAHPRPPNRPARRSQPCRPRPAPRPPGNRTPAPAPASRARRG